MTARRPLHPGLCLALIASSSTAQAQGVGPSSAPATTRPVTPATASQPAGTPTTTGSWGPDVYLEDLTFMLRDNTQISAAYFDAQNPDIWYVTSDDGHVWRTDDDGKSFEEIRIVVAPNRFYNDRGQRMFYGRHRASPPPGPAGVQRAARLGGSIQRMSRFHDDWMLVGPRAGVWNALLGRDLRSFSRQDLIRLRGERISELWFPIPHPYDPKIVYVCGFYGLFTSYDGGHTFLRTFIGSKPTGVPTYDVGVDPTDHDRVFLSTGEGAYYSTDGGRNFIRHPGKGIGEWLSFGFYFHPLDPRVVFSCTDHGILRSRDGGRNWELMYWSTQRRARLARRMAFDPFDPKKAYLNTFDGMFVIDDIINGGIEDWRRFGGLTFVGHYMRSVYACPKHRGHLWTLAAVNTETVADPGLPPGWPGFVNGFIYESIDGGKSWKVIFSGQNANNIVWFLPGQRDPDLLFIFSARSLVRMKRKAPGAPPPRPLRDLPVDPPISDVIQAALRFTGTDPALRLRYRRRANLRALLPRLDLSYVYDRARNLGVLHDSLYALLPFRRTQARDWRFDEFRLMLTWDLAPLVFDLQSALFGRMYRINEQLRQRIVIKTHQAYGRLRQLRALLANVPPDDLRLRLHYRLRIEEITALLNVYTGNYLDRWHGRLPGRQTRWLEPWTPGP